MAMDGISLVIGLPGLINDCLTLLERVDSMRAFDVESQSAVNRWKISKATFQKWATDVGIRDGKLMDSHHPSLEDPYIRSIIEDNIRSVQDICHQLNATRSKLRIKGDFMDEPSMDDLDSPQELEKREQSGLRERFGWMRRGRRFQDQIQLLQDHVDRIAKLVPPQSILTSQEGSRQIYKIRDAEEFVKVAEEKRKRIDEWLHVPRIDQQYHKHIESRSDGTCDWVFDHHAYQAWRLPDDADVEQQASILWINAPAGFGKTILCARMIQYLESSSESVLAYAFATAHVQARCKPGAIVRTWISKMLHQNPVAESVVWEHLQSRKADLVASDRDAFDMLKAIVTLIPGCTLVVDGYDEFDPSDNVRKELLRDLKATVAGSFTRVLITSRDEPDIRSELQEPTQECKSNDPTLIECKVAKEDVNDDITRFTRNITDEMLPSKTELLRSSLVEKMVKKSDGMFLWIKLQRSQLKDGKNKKWLDKAVNDMPEGLLDTYERNWRDIEKFPHEDQTRAIGILRWAVYAYRSLTISELTEALLVDATQGLSLDDMPDEINEAYIDGEIKTLCGSLIDIKSPGDEGTNASPGLRTVHLVHPSVKECLVSALPRSKIFHEIPLSLSVSAKQHNTLARICLSYLTCKEIWPDDGSSESSAEGPDFSCAFLDYAGRHWYRHAKAAEEDDHLTSLLNRFLSAESPSFDSWTERFGSSETTETEESRHTTRGPSTSLYYATLFNLTTSMEFFKEHPDVDLNFVGGQYGSALQAACAKGYTAAFDCLLQWNVDVNIHGGEFGSALHAAASTGREQMARRLIECGADTSHQNSDGDTPLDLAATNGHYNLTSLLLEEGHDFATTGRDHAALYAAAQGGHVEVVQLLLQHGANVKRLPKDGSSVLHAAAKGGNPQLIKLLLDQGASPVHRNDAGETPLLAAALDGHLEAFEMLLEHGADKTLLTTGFENWTPLHAAASRGHVDIVRLLLYKGARDCLDSKNAHGYTALHLAAVNNHPAVAEVLLDHGADQEITNDKGSTPLYGACIQADLEVVRMLLDRGSQPLLSVAADGGWTPLHAPAEVGGLEIATLLIDCGADATLQNESGMTPLYVAAKHGQLDVAKLLLKVAPDLVHQEGGELGTPLHMALSQGSIEMVKLLLENHADYASPNSKGITPVHMTAFSGSTEYMELFLQHGAHPRLRDKNGNTLVHVAARGGQVDVVKLLLEHESGVVHDAGNGYKQTPLFEAAKQNHVPVLEALLAAGADVRVADDIGWTCLHFVSELGYLEIAKLLVDHGADIEATVKSSDLTPVFLAAHHNSPDVLRFLLEKGAGCETAPNTGWTPLQAAADNGTEEIVDILLSHGADPTVPQKGMHFGRTPLYFAAENGYGDIIARLLATSVDYERLAGRQLLPVNVAARQGWTRTLKFLLKQDYHKGKTPVDVQGRTALHMAAGCGYLEVFDILLAHGFDPTITDHRGQSVFEYAADSSCYTMLEKVLRLDCAARLTGNTSSSSWTALHWAARFGDNKMLEKIMSLGIEERSIETADPPRSWTPWEIARFYDNKKVFGSRNCPLKLRSEQELNPAPGNGHKKDTFCEGCSVDGIIGVCFQLRGGSYYEYCFMCMKDGIKVHTEAEWERIEPDDDGVSEKSPQPKPVLELDAPPAAKQSGGEDVMDVEIVGAGPE